MRARHEHHRYALGVPAQDAKELVKALPEVAATFSNGRRVTNIEPLPTAELRKLYRSKDELAGVTVRQLSAFQSQKVPE